MALRARSRRVEQVPDGLRGVHGPGYYVRDGASRERLGRRRGFLLGQRLRLRRDPLLLLATRQLDGPRHRRLLLRPCDGNVLSLQVTQKGKVVDEPAGAATRVHFEQIEEEPRGDVVN